MNELLVTPRPLSAVAFRPFGEVIEHAGEMPRRMITSAFETDGFPSEQLLWVYRLPEPTRLPVRVSTMERHPHSAQLFVPLSSSGFLVAVCPSRDDGEPNIEALVAFVARGDQGIVYRRNVWHHPLIALGTGADFVVSLAKGCADDSVSTTVARAVTIPAMPEPTS